MDKYRIYLYRISWSEVYKQLQDAIFFTRAEVYPVDFSTPTCLRLHVSWYTSDNMHKTYEGCLPFDVNFPINFPKLIQCINDILCQASYGDCNCMGAILGTLQCY